MYNQIQHNNSMQIYEHCVLCTESVSNQGSEFYYVKKLKSAKFFSNQHLNLSNHTEKFISMASWSTPNAHQSCTMCTYL